MGHVTADTAHVVFNLTNDPLLRTNLLSDKNVQKAVTAVVALPTPLTLRRYRLVTGKRRVELEVDRGGKRHET